MRSASPSWLHLSNALTLEPVTASTVRRPASGSATTHQIPEGRRRRPRSASADRVVSARSGNVVPFESPRESTREAPRLSSGLSLSLAEYALPRADLAEIRCDRGRRHPQPSIFHFRELFGYHIRRATGRARSAYADPGPSIAWEWWDIMEAMQIPTRGRNPTWWAEMDEVFTSIDARHEDHARRHRTVLKCRWRARSPTARAPSRTSSSAGDADDRADHGLRHELELHVGCAPRKSRSENHAPLLTGGRPSKQIVKECFNHFIGRVGSTRVALAAVEFALWDRVQAGEPAAVALPRRRRDRVKAYSTDGWFVGAGRSVRDATSWSNAASSGQARARRSGEDLRRVAAVRKAVGDGVDIMTDVNCAWTLATSKQYGSRLADYDVKWLEEPMKPEDVAMHAELAHAIATPIAVGETIFTREAFRDYIAAGAVHYVQADATKLLGIDEWLEVASPRATPPVVPHTNVQHKLHAQRSCDAELAGRELHESLHDMGRSRST
jgi:hypothetical protein